MAATRCSGGSNISARPRSIARAASRVGRDRHRARRARASTTRSPSCAASCCSRCSPTSPRIGRASPPSPMPTSPTRSPGSPKQGIDRDAVLKLLDHALIVPVLTAHPTEVRRKSMIDHRNRIAELMLLQGCRRAGDRRRRSDRGGDRPPDRPALADPRAAPRAAVRRRRDRDRARLSARRVPADAARALCALGSRARQRACRASCALGNWIGGDRDGNPNVTAETLRLVLARSAEAVIGYYLDAIHALGAELSISTELTPVERGADRTRRGRARSPARARGDEPYRRALTGIYARLAATYRGDRRARRRRARAAGQGGRLCRSRRVPPRSRRRSRKALREQGGGALGSRRRAQPADPRGRDLRLPPRHARPAPECRRPRARRRRTAQGRRRRGRLSRARRGRRASPCCAANSRMRRPLSSAWGDYSDETRVRARDRRMPPPRRMRATGRPASRIYNISKAESVSDLLEVHTLLKEVGLYRPPRGEATPPRRDHGGAAVRDDRRSRECAGRDDRLVRAARDRRADARRAAIRR